LIYYKKDKLLQKIASHAPAQVIAYDTPAHHIDQYQTYLDVDYNYELTDKEGVGVPLQIFGKHNLQNFQAARMVCRELGLSDGQIFKAIQEFSGAAKRFETLSKKEKQVVFKDFAHAPSKVKATINAVKQQYKDRKLIAALELHTFSSLNIDFLEEYVGSMGAADMAYVYYNPHTIRMKKLEAIEPSKVEDAFFHPNLTVFTDEKELEAQLQKDIAAEKANLLLMSSGNWGGIDIMKLIGE
jgi:UDP-N-acetylmuramate: L-alanyl-gamma-D-glutamyl-meso-diaminopimelate ligase